MSRIRDVGNPWLDAGIVSFSTMHYNTDRREWRKWYPADFVTECFPGQFRNWFYSLLAMAAMMDNSPPFKNLLGHRLVMNEAGEPMHKSDGTAIWFEEAAEQLGVDTMRWMYLAQNPALDLRFGTRHPDRPVTIPTPDGPASETAEGEPICEVTSKPSDEIRRRILIPLWNSYAFFVNYARLDEFDPTTGSAGSLQPVPIAERPEIDRWILSNLQTLIEAANRGFQNFDVADVCTRAAAFIDDLSNWYIRRNRRRFWRSRDAADRDKLAAYQTLYEVLVTLTKLLAPIIPFLTERMYQNLCRTVQQGACPGATFASLSKAPPPRREGEAPAEPHSALRTPHSAFPESVHLCQYPQADTALLDPELNRRMAAAQLVVRLGHKLREESNQRVRQPLAELRYACSSLEQTAAVESLADVVTDELNVKRLTACDHLDELVSYNYKPNLKTLGPKYGKLLAALRQRLADVDPETLAPLQSGESVTIDVDGNPVTLLPDDVLIHTRQAADWIVTGDRGVQVALSTALTPALKREGMARDFVRQVQQLRKEADLEIENRIHVSYHTDDAELQTAVDEWSAYIRDETLADSLATSDQVPPDTKSVTIGGTKAPVWIEKV